MTIRTTILLAMMLLPAALASPARATGHDDVSVQLISSPASEGTHGYSEYRVAINNSSARDSHSVKLFLPQQSYMGGTVTRTVVVQPSSTVTVSLFTSIALAGNGLGVEVDGQESEMLALGLGGYNYDPRPSVLISQGASSRGFQGRAGTVLKTPDGKESFQAVKSVAPVAEWSTNWLGYSSYDGVVVTSDEMRALSESAVSALIRYVECGGALLVIGSWEVPQAWRAEKIQGGWLASYNASFGVCMVSENAAVEGLANSQWELIQQSWEQSQEPWSRAGGIIDSATTNANFPVMENVNIPVRGLLAIMLVFVILIGPVNLFVLAKKKKKMWMLWTVPLISLVTCVAVSAYSLFSEGWSGRARYLSFTILDERTHRATTIGLNAFYSPLTPGDGLRYGTETEVTPPGSRYGYYGDSHPARNADWTEDQHLETGWVTARAPSHFTIRRSETRRERLTMSRGTDGSVTVVNGLGVPIRTLWLSDEMGIIYSGSGIEPGASAKLLMTKDPPATGKVARLRNVFVGNWSRLMQRGGDSADLVMPSRYIASLDTCPFLEEGLRGVKQKRSEALVYGIMKGPKDAD